MSAVVSRVNPLKGKLTPAQAAQHLLNRRRAREHVIDYAGYIEVPGRPVDVDNPDCELFYPVETNLHIHHKLALGLMTRVSSRPSGRGLLLMPPGTAKTTYGSVVFPSHYMGANPGHRLILTSYGDVLASKMGRRTRSILRQARYKALFDTELTRDSQAAHQFSLTNGSEYMASSILGGITGNRAEGALGDDLIRGRQDAESELVRASTWDAWQDDFMTRLVPKGWAVLTMTHWDEEDPAGHILPDGWSGDSGLFTGKDGLDWEVLCIQARCETQTDPLGRAIGEYLVQPGWFDEAHWKQFEHNPRTWNSLYQQRPRPLEGAFFAAEDMLVDNKPVPVPNKVDVVFAIIDSAMKDGQPHDGVGVMFFGFSKLNRPKNFPLTVLDWDYVQIKGAFLHEWIPSVFVRGEKFAKECGAFKGFAGVWIEDAASGIILLQQTQHQDWRKAHPNWRTAAISNKLKSLGKKARAANASGHVKAGEVKWTEHAYTKTVTFKETTKNHAWSQILKFSTDSTDKDPDDLLDDFCYGIAMALGNTEGF